MKLNFNVNKNYCFPSIFVLCNHMGRIPFFPTMQTPGDASPFFFPYTRMMAMANMRKMKQELKEILQKDDWQEHLGEIATFGMPVTGALFSFLLLEPSFMHRAARALGATVAAIYEQSPEAARNIVRRFMWHMNEDSGNIGWGIPVAFAETLVASPPLAKEYAHILLSYIMDLGFADNYCDQDMLRRQCYWGIGRLAETNPALAEKSRHWLTKGLQDEDSLCRGMAAWALGELGPSLSEMPALKALANSGNEDRCEIFVGDRMEEKTVSELARDALGKVHAARA